MNKNKIFFVQSHAKVGGNRQCFVVSSPTMGEAITEVQEHWLSEVSEVFHCEMVRDMVDTDDYMDGKTYVKIHN